MDDKTVKLIFRTVLLIYHQFLVFPVSVTQVLNMTDNEYQMIISISFVFELWAVLSIMMKCHTVPLCPPLNTVITLSNISTLYKLPPLSHLGATLTVAVSKGLCLSNPSSTKMMECPLSRFGSGYRASTCGLQS